MIIILNKNDFLDHPDLAEQMRRSMTSRFQNRPGRVSATSDHPDMETPEGSAPLYVLSVCDKIRTLRSVCRLLQTSGPHMMSEVYGAHFEPDAVLRSPLIWEMSGLGRSKILNDTATPSGLHRPTIEVLAAVCELGLRYGMSHVCSVLSLSAGRLLRRAGLRISTIGRSASLGNETLLAGIWELDQATLQNLQRSGGIHGSVLQSRSAPGPVRRPGQAA